MAAHDFDWFLQNEDAYNQLSVEQLHVLGQGGTVDLGETEAPVEETTSTEPAAESTESPAGVDDEPVVLTKDGKHTIPFEDYRSAKDRAQAAEERIAELEAAAAEQSELIENLKAAKASDAGTGDTVAQDEVLRDFKAQYPELAESLAPALDKLLAAKDAQFAERLAAVEAKFADAINPIQHSAEEAAVEKHFATIRGAVNDFDQLVESGDVDKWVETLPSFARTGAQRVLAEGTATEIIELFGQYKAANAAPAPETSDPKAVKAAADAAIAKARKPVPTSLSDVPAAAPQASGEEPTTAEGWSRYFASLSSEQIMKQL